MSLEDRGDLGRDCDHFLTRAAVQRLGIEMGQDQAEWQSDRDGIQAARTGKSSGGGSLFDQAKGHPDVAPRQLGHDLPHRQRYGDFERAAGEPLRPQGLGQNRQQLFERYHHEGGGGRRTGSRFRHRRCCRRRRRGATLDFRLAWQSLNREWLGRSSWG